MPREHQPQQNLFAPHEVQQPLTLQEFGKQYAEVYKGSWAVEEVKGRRRSVRTYHMFLLPKLFGVTTQFLQDITRTPELSVYTGSIPVMSTHHISREEENLFVVSTTGQLDTKPTEAKEKQHSPRLRRVDGDSTSPSPGVPSWLNDSK